MRRVNMARLSVVASHKVNGVSALHSRLLAEKLFPEYAALWPGRFENVTNGISPRLWLMQSNPRLSALIDEAIGEGWRRNFDEIADLERSPTMPLSATGSCAVKRANKERAGAGDRAAHRRQGRSRQHVRRAGEAHPRV